MNTEHTDFGRLLRKLTAENDITQGKMAKDLGISPAMLSNYMTGKNIPEMELIDTCIRRYNLKASMVKDIFSKAFFSTATANHKIVLDTAFFKPERIETLAQIITIILLYPDSPQKNTSEFRFSMQDISKQAQREFDYLDKEIDYAPLISSDESKDTPD
jgi:transcriptional regulator with XRE-family HTH domain